MKPLKIKKKTYKEYELDLLGVEGAHKQIISSYRFWYEHIKKNAFKNDGDIFEFGVYRGNSLITAALILKELNSKKKIYGFDTFEGFPSLSKIDDLNQFKKNKYFSKKFQNEFKNFLKLKKTLTKNKKFNCNNISTSGDFSESSYEHVMEKIEYFKLNNVKLIKGEFKKTVPEFFNKNNINISSCNIDCDLYDGYRLLLPYVYQNLSKKGYIYLDEYYSLKFPGAKIATDDFCKKLKIKPKKHLTRQGEFERYYLTK
jgi:hypothetical protein